jgi:hypothetical protein
VLNYRGRPVFLGLGVVWLLWAGCAILGGVGSSMLHAESSLSVLPILTLAGPLALVAFSLGLVDDAYGTAGSRGFRGHLSALRWGRLTTGGLKLFGISLASFIVALLLAEIAPWGRLGQSGPWFVRFALALVAGAAIALTANFVNLTDLRPGRSLKVYAILAAAGVALTGLVLAPSFLLANPSMIRLAGWDRVAELVALALFAAGPLVAVYRYDVGEIGMLGDAGANPMGAVAGLLIIAGLPLWGLALYASAILALNVASERVSFSRVIESNALLSRLDALGRDVDAEESAQMGSPEEENVE